MPQVLQIWKAADPVFAPNLPGPPSDSSSQSLRSLIADATGGFTAVWTTGLAIYSGGYDTFGSAIGNSARGSFSTGFIEWGGSLEEVFRGTGDKLVLTSTEIIIPGLSPGPPSESSLRTADVDSVSEFGVGGPFSFGSAISASYTAPTVFSTDTAQLRNGGLVTILIADESAVVFPVPQPAVPTSAVAIIRDALGNVTGTMVLAGPGNLAMNDATIAGFGDNSFVGVWDQSGVGIVASRVIAGVVQAPVTVNQVPWDDRSAPSAATMADGNVVIVWQDEIGPFGDPLGNTIRGRIMRPDGTFSTAVFMIDGSVSAASEVVRPVAVGLNVNQFMVLWTDVSGALPTLCGRVFGFDGVAVTAELTIATGNSSFDFSDLTAAVLADGRVAVGWYDPANPGVFDSHSVILDPRTDAIFGTSGGETILGRGYVNAGLLEETIVAGDGNDTIWGFAGNDQLYGETGQDLIYGGNGNDLINGGADNDVLWGEIYSTESGNDTILGGDGHDLIFAMAGNDSVLGEAGNDTLLGNFGNDTLFGGDGSDGLYGEDGDDVALGSDGDDVLFGQDGADALYGDAGADTLLGGAGNDTVYSGDGLNALYGDDGNDLMYGGANVDYLFGQTGADTLYGGGGIDVLLGGDDSDAIYGEAGADVLYGEAGNDTLDGGLDGDVYFTGTGADVIRLEANYGVDVVYDFADGTDRIQFATSTGIAGLGQLTLVDVPGFAVIVSNGSALYIYGISTAQLSEADFMFGG